VPELSRFYATLSVHGGRTIALLHHDGTILANHPRNDSLIGKSVATRAEWFRGALANGLHVYRDTHFLTGVDSIASTHGVLNLPLLVDVSRDVDDVLSGWWKQIRYLMVGQAIVLLATTFFIVMILRQFAQQDRQLVLLRQMSDMAIRNADRLADFAQLASDWYWEQDASLRFVPIETRTPSTRDARDASDYGKTRRELSRMDLVNTDWDQHEADLAARRPFRDFRYQRIGSDGRLHHVSVSGKPIFAPDGAFLGYRGVGRDVTADMEAAAALREARDKAEAAMLARSRFLANTSHELRTPLHVIIGFSELIANHPQLRDHPMIVEHARDVHASGRELLSRINAILDLSRLEGGIYQLRDDQVRIGTTVQACVDLHRAQAAQKRISIQCVDAVSDQTVRCDGAALRQCLGYVLDNAVKFTPADGQVTIRVVQPRDGGLAIAVSDTGIGMTEEVLAQVLQPFYQGDTTLQRAHGGSGVGLAVCDRLMRLHGGRIEIDSAPERGTTVSLIFPAERVGPQAPSDAGAPRRRRPDIPPAA
jgi:signal transduction histidine kinase